MTVGWRQVGISREQTKIAARQTEILNEQAKLEGLRLRESLFDRRMDVYEPVAWFLAHFVQRATRPPAERERAFLNALNRAQFLFRNQVSTDLKAIWTKACEFGALKAKMDHLFATEGHYGGGNPEKEAELLLWFNAQLESLSDVFGDELRLGQSEEPQPASAGTNG